MSVNEEEASLRNGGNDDVADVPVIDMTLPSVIQPLIDVVLQTIDHNRKNAAGIQDLRDSMDNLTDGLQDVLTNGEHTVDSLVYLLVEENVEVHGVDVVDTFFLLKRHIRHASNYDVSEIDGFRSLWERVEEHMAFLIPYLRGLQSEEEELGEVLGALDRLMNSVEEEFEGDSVQEGVFEGEAIEHEVLLNGNRCRLALEHKMFVQWLRGRGDGDLYDLFRVHLGNEHEAGNHYGEGGNLEQADEFHEDTHPPEGWG